MGGNSFGDNQRIKQKMKKEEERRAAAKREEEAGRARDDANRRATGTASGQAPRPIPETVDVGAASVEVPQSLAEEYRAGSMSNKRKKKAGL